MLKEDPNKIYELLEQAYQQYNGNVSELLGKLLDYYECQERPECEFKSGEYFKNEHNKRVMPKLFWDILFKNIESFKQKPYFELLTPIFESCVCPEKLFYDVYNIVPNISDYLDYYEGNCHNGVYWNRNTKYVRLMAHARRNQTIRLMLLTMLMNPNCPLDVKEKIASSQDKAKYYMVTDIAKNNITVSSPIVGEIKHTLPFTNLSEEWWNPACSEKIIGDLFSVELQLCSNLTTDEKNIISMLDKNTPEEVLRKLADNDNAYIRGKVAKHENCPEEVLTMLSVDKEFYVRYNCFCNVKTPEKAFTKNIQKNFNMNDCIMMLCHPNCPSEVVSKIFKGDFSYVGYLSDECPNLPEEVIECRLSRNDCFAFGGCDYIDLFCRKNCTSALIERLIKNDEEHCENADFLASLTVFYDIVSKHVEPQYKSSYNSNQEAKAFQDNCRAEIAFTSKMAMEPSFLLINPTPLGYIEPANHARPSYNINDFISNNPKCLTLKRKIEPAVTEK